MNRMTSKMIFKLVCLIKNNIFLHVYELVCLDAGAPVF